MTAHACADWLVPVTREVRCPCDQNCLSRGGPSTRPRQPSGVSASPSLSDQATRAVTAARAARLRAALILSDGDVSVERIADLVGHSTPNTTQTVYRHQIRPVIVHGAEAMDTVFGNGDQAG
ncbi:hypothetical protein AB0M50_10165 [Nonomuraea fuscirosea]|uniref:hypothetical protein n=1 Tax=Nonomuraea fuscirosea TaxID=1291556 RepID=UPI00342CB31E